MIRSGDGFASLGISSRDLVRSARPAPAAAGFFVSNHTGRHTGRLRGHAIRGKLRGMSEPIVRRAFNGMPLAQQQDMLLQASLHALALSPASIAALNRSRREREASKGPADDREGGSAVGISR